MITIRTEGSDKTRKDLDYDVLVRRHSFDKSSIIIEVNGSPAVEIDLVEKNIYVKGFYNVHK